MVDRSKEPEELSRAAFAKHKDRVRVLGYELEQVIKLLGHARECLENELYSGLGYKKLGITDKDLTKVNMLARSLETAVSAKVRFDKAQKQMHDEMTTGEQLEAVVEYVKSMDPDEIRAFIERVRPESGRPLGNQYTARKDG